jgi:hypothetical protein
VHKQIVVIDPVDCHEYEADEIDRERGPKPQERCRLGRLRRLQLEHHDGDDYGDDSVREGFKAAHGKAPLGFRHCPLLSLAAKRRPLLAVREKIKGIAFSDRTEPGGHSTNHSLIAGVSGLSQERLQDAL